MDADSHSTPDPLALLQAAKAAGRRVVLVSMGTGLGLALPIHGMGLDWNC